MAAAKKARKEKPTRRFIHGETVAMNAKEWAAFDRVHEVQHFVKDASLAVLAEVHPRTPGDDIVDRVERLVAALDARGYFASPSVAITLAREQAAIVKPSAPRKRR